MVQHTSAGASKTDNVHNREVEDAISSLYYMYQKKELCVCVSLFALDTAEELSSKGRRYECLSDSKQA